MTSPLTHNLKVGVNNLRLKTKAINSLAAKMENQQILYFYFLLTSILLVSSIPLNQSTTTTTIALATWLRSSYSFDIYSLPISKISNHQEIRHTDGISVNYNGHFPNLPPPNQTHSLIYVTERDGTPNIYLDTLYDNNDDETVYGKRAIFETSTESTRVQVLLVGDTDGLEKRVSRDRPGFDILSESTRTGTESTRSVGENGESGRRVSMKDRPSLVGSSLIYVSTHENPGKSRTSWAAVYSTQLGTGFTRRLTPKGVADFSPAVSPSGVFTAVASYGEKGWQGESEELGTDVYVFSTRDGSKRVKVVEHGGWPSWGDDSSFYFHRRCDDGWWSVFRADFVVKDGEIDLDSVATQRVTPPGLHAFTPAASVADKSFIAVATRREGSEFRHVELYDVVLNEFVELTRLVSPNAHHFNPFVSPDSLRVGYHKCRGVANDVKAKDLITESIRSPLGSVSLVRVDGSFPSYSPDGKRIAYVKLPTEPMAYVSEPGVFVMNSDGTGVRNVLNRTAFPTAWDWKRKGVVYTSVGPIFAGEKSNVDIISINVDDPDLSYKTLTKGGENNAFPSPSPDGKWVAFRSGRSGYKNLYVMDALEGEAGGIYRLTEGPWTDTMCNWSPDGEWIAFSSDRNDPGSGGSLGSYELFKIHPNGTGLQKVIQSGTGGKVNHPWFSPDSQHIVFASDYAGVSAEPIGNPFHYQPYGDIFVTKSDGSDIRRLTHNSYEDGTPSWSPKFAGANDAEWPNEGLKCSFADNHWLNV